MRATNRAMCALVLVCAAGCGSKPKTPGVGANLDPKVTADELATLAGTWVYEKQVVEGKDLPVGGTKPDTIVVSGNTMVRHVFDATGRALNPVKSTLSVDPTTTPKQMDDDADVGFRISRRLGIYKLEGDRLTLCYDNTGKVRPTAFDSPPGTTFVLTVLKRQGK